MIGECCAISGLPLLFRYVVMPVAFSTCVERVEPMILVQPGFV